ncbi:MAG TPA: ATP-binding protein [Burkholderiaceae bacterium]|nr:ATP-binding protein [Burkholderiaceae bacterium]
MASVRSRLLVSLLAVFAAGAAILGATTYRNVIAESEALFDYQLSQMALSLRDQGSISADNAAALADEKLEFVVQIWGPDGTTIYASQPYLRLPERAILGFSDVDLAGARWRVFSTLAHDRVIQVAQPIRVRRDRAAHAALKSVVPLLALAPLLAIAIWWQVGASLASLDRLAADVKRRRDEALEPLSQDGVPAEVAPLIVALNGLLARLGRAFDAQRAFVSDAAHELRSPLTALKLQLQLVRRAPDDASRQQALATLSAGIERAIHTVEQLLALARAEPGGLPSPATEVDLGEAARLAAADVVPLALQRGTTIEMPDAEADGTTPGVRVRGDPALLRLLARNLVDNAVRYSPAAARVELRVAPRADGPGAAALVVDDSGPGIPPAERERVFDRFYRRGESEESGSGLGLAIVKGIADRHGATIALGDSPLGGLRVTVTFPASMKPATRDRPSPAPAG